MTLPDNKVANEVKRSQKERHQLRSSPLRQGTAISVTRRSKDRLKQARDRYRQDKIVIGREKTSDVQTFEDIQHQLEHEARELGVDIDELLREEMELENERQRQLELERSKVPEQLELEAYIESEQAELEAMLSQLELEEKEEKDVK